MCDDILEDCCCDGCDCCKCLPSEYRWTMAPIGFIIGFGLFLTVVLVPLAIKRVDFDEVAIRYKDNKVSREIGPDVLREGLHDIGPAGELLVLKRTQRQGFIPNMTTLTSDGLEVYLSVDVLYSIQPDRARSIIDLYYDQNGHDLFIMSMANTVVRDVISSFSARSFFLQRQEVQDQMQTLLEQRFTNGSAYATVEAVQLSNVDFSFAVSTALEFSTIIQQDIENAKAERDTLVNQATNRRALAQLESELTLLAADRNVKITNLRAGADQKSTAASLTARAEAFGNISLSFNNGAEFFVYEYLRNLLLRLNTGRTIVGLD